MEEKILELLKSIDTKLKQIMALMKQKTIKKIIEDKGGNE